MKNNNTSEKNKKVWHHPRAAFFVILALSVLVFAVLYVIGYMQYIQY